MTLGIPDADKQGDAPTEQIKPVAVRSKPRSRRSVNKDIQQSFPDLAGSHDDGET